MDTFFLEIYSAFCDEDNPLFEVMHTLANSDGEEMLASAFVPLGISTIVVSFLVAFAFYIWPLAHPRFKAWWAWLITLGVNGVISYLLAIILGHYRVAEIENDNDLMGCVNGDKVTIVGDVMDIPSGEWFDFAFANVWFGVVIFLIASLVLTWFSTTCKYSPFKK